MAVFEVFRTAKPIYILERSQTVRHWTLTPVCVGSTPTGFSQISGRGRSLLSAPAKADKHSFEPFIVNRLDKRGIKRRRHSGKAENLCIGHHFYYALYGNSRSGSSPVGSSPTVSAKTERGGDDDCRTNLSKSTARLAERGFAWLVLKRPAGSPRIARSAKRTKLFS